MSDFTFPCPLCQEAILCGDEYHGQPLQCPVCQGEITAPEADVKTPGGGRHSPTLPGHRRQVVLKKKSGAGKIAIVTGTIALILAALFFTARYMGWDSHLPAFLGRRAPAATEANAAAAAPGANVETPATSTPPPPPAPIVWTTNLATMIIPTNAAYGRITALEFKYDSARVDNGSLALRQGTNPAPDLELGVFFGLKAGESLSGKTIEVTPEARVAPRVWKKWKMAGKTALQQKVYSKGYAMKLQFGAVSEDKVPGTIFLSFPDEDQSVVAGSFVATVGNAALVQPAAQADAPAAAPMSEQMRKRYGIGGTARP